MILEISISTNKEDVEFIVERICKRINAHKVVCTVIWQNMNITEGEIWLRENIRVLGFNEKGLSRSRNGAIEKALGDIILFTDDDIFLKENIYEKIIKAYKKLPDADIITFKALWNNGSNHKKYASQIKRHDLRSIMKVSSIEITAKIDSIKRLNLRFNELFGLGSVFPSCEENLFLFDALKKELNIYFYPESIVVHPNPTTSSHNFSPEILKSKGAFFCEIFGNLSYLIVPMFAIKKIRLEPNVIKSIFLMYKGLWEYKKYEKYQ